MADSIGGSHIDGRVRHVEAEVGALKVSVAQLGTDVTEIKDGQRVVFGKLDSLIGTMASVQAQRPQSWDKVLDFVVKSAVLIGMGTGAILFVARGLNLEALGPMREELAVMRYRLEQAEKHGAGAATPALASWSPQIKRP